MQRSQILGCLLGIAVGDSIGLPYEGLSRKRAQRLFGPPDRHRFLWQRGFFSDDTEQNCLVLQAFCEAGGDCDQFRVALARRLRWWFASLPPGIGMATAKSILRLWCGYPPARSGVFSAGNGASMRAPLLGVLLDDPDEIERWVEASSLLTHSDPRAIQGAQLIAQATWLTSRRSTVSKEDFWQRLLTRDWFADSEWKPLLERVLESLDRSEATLDFAKSLQLERGVTGYICHTLPVVIHAWLTHADDLRSAVMTAVSCGGDTDTTAAIVGGIVGAGVGEAGIPAEWLTNLGDWPRSVSWLRKLAESVPAEDAPVALARELPLPLLLVRNLFVLAVVLAHGFRRLAPPY